MPAILPKFTYVKRSGDALTPLGAFVCLFLMAMDLFYAYALSSQLKALQMTIFSLPAHIISLTAFIGYVLAGYISLPLRGLLACTLVGSAVPVLVCGIVLTAGSAQIEACSYGLAAFVGIALGIRVPGTFVYMLDVSRNMLGHRTGFLISGYLFSFCLSLVQQAFLYRAIGMVVLNSATPSTSESELATLYRGVIPEHISYLTLSYGIVLALGSIIFIISSVPHKTDSRTGDYTPHKQQQKVASFRALSSAVAAPVVSPFHITGVKVGDQYVANSSSQLATNSPRTAYSSTIKTPADVSQAEANPHAVLASTDKGSIMFAVQSVHTMKNMTFAAYETSFNNSGNDIRYNGIKSLRLFNKGVGNTLLYNILALVCLFFSLEILLACIAYIQYNSSSLGHLSTMFKRLAPDLTKVGGFSSTSQSNTLEKRAYLTNLFILSTWCAVACFLLIVFALLAAFITPLFVSYRQRLLEIPASKKVVYSLVTPVMLALLFLYLPTLLVSFFCGTTECPGYENPFAVYFVLAISMIGAICVLFLVSVCVAYIYDFTEQLQRKFSRPIIRLMALPLIISPLLTRLLVFDLARIPYFHVDYTALNSTSTRTVLIFVGILVSISAVLVAIGLTLMILGHAHEHTVKVSFEKLGITLESMKTPKKRVKSSENNVIDEGEILQEIPRPFSRVLLEPSDHERQDNKEAQCIDTNLQRGKVSHYPNKADPSNPGTPHAYAENLGKSTYQMEDVCDNSGLVSPTTVSPGPKDLRPDPRDSIADP